MKLIVAICALAVLSGCAQVERLTSGGDRYIDLTFPVPKDRNEHYPRTVDSTGALWYIDGSDVVRQSAPSVRHVVHDPAARSGNIFWYEGAVYVVNGDGKTLSRLSDKPDPIVVPGRYAPVEGVVADPKHRWVVLAQETPKQLAVLDRWKWYGERLPSGIVPFASALAGGPHGKKYLVVGDQRKPVVAIENRWTGRALVVRVPDNACFVENAAAWHVPVDVRGRDGDRTWVTTGQHVSSIELSTKHVLRTWDLVGCALRILRADDKAVTVLVATHQGDAYASGVVRVDHDGIQPLGQYGELEGVVNDVTMDRYDRLWWFDRKTHAFVCRTPLT